MTKWKDAILLKEKEPRHVLLSIRDSKGYESTVEVQFTDDVEPEQLKLNLTNTFLELAEHFIRVISPVKAVKE